MSIHIPLFCDALSMQPLLVQSSYQGVVSLTFLELSKIFSWNLCICRNRSFHENFKLKLCMCAQSHALGTRTKFQLEILTINVISSIVYFREIILESLRNVSETTSSHLYQGSLAKLAWISKHYNDVIISKMASQITSLTIAYSTGLFRPRSNKTLMLRITGLCEGNSPGTSEFSAQRASKTENVSIWWRHHDMSVCSLSVCNIYAIVKY